MALFGSLSRAVRRTARQYVRQSVNPRVNRRAAGPPAPRRRPPPPQRVRQPQAFRIRPQGFQRPQRQAQRRVVRAQKAAPPEHRLPYVPVLKHYTPKERHYINRLVQQKGSEYARQTGQKPNQALTTLAQTGDPSTKSALQAYSKLYLEQRRENDARAFRNTFGHKAAEGMSTRQQALAFRKVSPHGQIKPGPKPQGGIGGTLATITPTIAKTVTQGVHPVAGMSWTRVGQSAGELAAPAVRDALGLPANIASTGYQVGRAGVGLATGNPKPAKQLFHAIKETDPIALTLQGRTDEAWKAVKEHPLYAYLEVAGAKGAVGRGVGRPARALGAVPKERVPASLPGTEVKLRRPTSNDIFRAGRQLAQDRRNVRRADTLRAEADRVEPTAPDLAVERRQKANKVDPRVVSPGEVTRRTTETFAANEVVRSHNRDALLHAVRKAGVPKHGAELVSLVAQNIVHPSRADVLAYRRELDLEHAHLGTKSKRAANRRTAAALDSALSDRKLDFAKVEKAADDFAAISHPVNQRLVDLNLIPGSQAEKARLIPYAVRRMGAHHDGEQIVGPAGGPLSTADIRAHMQAHGVTREPVYLPQGPSTRGARNFFVNFAQRPAVGGPARTGEATRAGLLDVHPDTLHEGVARQQGLVDAEHGFRRFVGEQGLRDPGGELVSRQSRREIDAVAREATQTTGQRFVPIRLEPFAARREQLEALLEDTAQGHSSYEGPQTVRDALAEAVGGAEGASPGPGPWGLIHESAAETFHQHNRVLGSDTAGKTMQFVNRQFRQAVLPLSIKWLFGNVAEATLRNTIARAGPLSYVKGSRTLKALDRTDPQVAAEVRARAVGGGHYSGIKIPYRSAEQFRHANAVVSNLARGLGAAARAPGVRTGVDLWRRYTHFVFETVNGRLERGFQTALAGKHLIGQHGIAVSSKAIEQAARGLTNTNEQVAMGRFVDRAYGKYGKFTPSERRIVANFTPFAAWFLNATKFIYQVLPRDHPVLVGLLASADRAEEEWRKQHGLDLYATGHVKEFLQGSIPGGKAGTFVRAGRYTPFGAFGDFPGTIAEQVLPQYGGFLNALKGKDWKGDPLRGNPGPEQKMLIGLQQFVESTIPGSGQFHRLAIGQGKAKDAPFSQRLQREFNPVYPVQATQTKKGSGISKSGNSHLDELQRLRQGSTTDPALEELQKLRGGK